MFQLIYDLNITGRDPVKDIKIRGYESAAWVTGQFRLGIEKKNIPLLAVSDIAYEYCPTRRDLYFKKGKNRPSNKKFTQWEREVGMLVDDYFIKLLSDASNSRTYSDIKENGDVFHKQFVKDKTQELDKLKQKDDRIKDTEWLMEMLNSNARAELGVSLLHEIIKEEVSLNSAQIEPKPKIKPNRNIGINSPSEPDFIIPDHNIVGDIKTGDLFREYFLLTCAGYALAYESEKRRNIDWGIIYFFPTRAPSTYSKPITFSQIYLFKIDDALRTWFLAQRDNALQIISKSSPPGLPDENQRDKCYKCRFISECKKQGLELK